MDFTVFDVLHLKHCVEIAVITNVSVMLHVLRKINIDFIRIYARMKIFDRSGIDIEPLKFDQLRSLQYGINKLLGARKQRSCFILPSLVSPYVSAASANRLKPMISNIASRIDNPLTRVCLKSS